MGNTITFFVHGTPRSWKAPEFNRKTGAVYKPAQDKVWGQSVWGQAAAYKPETPHRGPVSVHLVFYQPIPRSWPNWRRRYVQGQYTECTPDWDNLAKGFIDALKGMFFLDDRQICDGHAERRYEYWDPAWNGRFMGPGVLVRMTFLPSLPTKKAELPEVDEQDWTSHKDSWEGDPHA